MELMDFLTVRGVNCFVLLPWWGSLAGALRKRGVSFCVIPYLWWVDRGAWFGVRLGKTLFNLAMLLPIAIRVHRWQCDILYTNTLTMCVGALTARLLGRPHVLHIHEFGDRDHGLTFDLGERFSLNVFDRCSSLVIANSHAVAEKFKGHFQPGKLKVVYYSVQMAFPSEGSQRPLVGQGEDTFQCVLVGLLQPGKGQEDAIRAVAVLLRERVKVHLWIVGRASHPTYARFLSKLVKKNGLEDHVQFLGYQEKPLPFFQASDVVLSCSRSEAFGRVTVEAMRAGKPVVGANSGATPELIRDGWNGFLYKPGDYRDLAQKVRYLYEHPDLAREMGRQGQRWAAEQFTPERYGGEILKELERLSSPRGA